jgi:hypothetical protein
MLIIPLLFQSSDNVIELIAEVHLPVHPMTDSSVQISDYEWQFMYSFC